MMREAMVRMDMARRLKANRVLSTTMSFLALLGWGAFAYSAGSSASTTRDLRAELAQVKTSQDQLLAGHKQQQEAAGDLAQVQAKLASARSALEALARKREKATAQATTAQHELASLTKRLESRRAKLSETRRARVAEQVSKSDRGATPGKEQEVRATPTWHDGTLTSPAGRTPDRPTQRPGKVPGPEGNPLEERSLRRRGGRDPRSHPLRPRGPGSPHRPPAPTVPRCAGSCGSPAPRCPAADPSELPQQPAPTGRPQAGSSPPSLFATAPGPSPTVPVRPPEHLGPEPRWPAILPGGSRTSGGPTPPPLGL